MKPSKTWSAPSIALSFTCGAVLLAAAPLHGALVAHLTFDDPANLNADSSGNGNHATASGSPSATAGIVGGAASFNGASYLKWEGSSSPVVQLLNGSFTVGVWVKTTQTFASDGSYPWEGAGLVWADYPGTPPIGDTIPLALTGSKAAGFANSPTVHSTNSINSGQWTHLAFVRYANAAGGYVRLFVNGQLEATESSNGQPASDAQIVAVAANILDGRYYVGSMDDLRLYNTALSDSEIVSVYNLRQAATQWTTNNLPAGLIAWWQGEGNMLDSAGAHHGSGSAAPTYAPGRFGQAFQFNGTDQSVSIPDGYADLDSWTQFTLEAWVYLDNRIDGAGGGQAIISKVGDGRQPGPDLGYQFGFGQGATKLFCQFNASGQAWPGFQTIADLGGPAPTNTWLHVAATYDHNAVIIYFNGVPLVTNVVGPATIVNCDASLRLNSDDNENVFFAGRIDDARVFNRGLAVTEIGRLALGLPGAYGVWGLKTHDPVSQPPTTLFYFNENGSNFLNLGYVTLGGVEIEADGLAMSPAGGLFAFQMNTSGGSRLLSLNPTTAVATVVGPVLTNRNLRGATFTLSGRLLAFDYALRELIEVNATTGEQVGAGIPLSTNLSATSTAGDLTEMPDGSLLFAYNAFLYRLDPRSGVLTRLLEDTAPLADGYLPYCCGVACAANSIPADKLFCYEASINDDVYQYLPSSSYGRLQLYDNIISGYNAGRGDLAALPAGRVELLDISVSGTNATLSTVCRGGVLARVEYTDDLGAPNWQFVPGTTGWVPYTSGTIATPMTWTNLPATAAQRFYRVILP